MNAATLRVRVLRSIDEIEAAAWDACANPDASNPSAAATAQDLRGGVQPSEAAQGPSHEDPPHEERNNPFICYDFLHALEASESVGARAGWQVQHLVTQREDGRLIGAVPCYLKSHSRVEYVFDHGWA